MDVGSVVIVGCMVMLVLEDPSDEVLIVRPRCEYVGVFRVEDGVNVRVYVVLKSDYQRLDNCKSLNVHTEYTPTIYPNQYITQRRVSCKTVLVRLENDGLSHARHS